MLASRVVRFSLIVPNVSERQRRLAHGFGCRSARRRFLWRRHAHRRGSVVGVVSRTIARASLLRVGLLLLFGLRLVLHSQVPDIELLQHLRGAVGRGGVTGLAPAPYRIPARVVNDAPRGRWRARLFL